VNDAISSISKLRVGSGSERTERMPRSRSEGELAKQDCKKTRFAVLSI
jgi:hypothetical protein